MGGWIRLGPLRPPPDPPKLSRHDLLQGLHEVLSPSGPTSRSASTRDPASRLSRTRSIAVDPEFAVTKALHCDLHLVKAKSDDFFTRKHGLAHFDGVPIDLAFIDGMHLSEYALRDFINIERYLAPPAWWSSTTCCRGRSSRPGPEYGGLGRRRLQGGRDRRPAPARPAGPAGEHLTDRHPPRGRW